MPSVNNTLIGAIRAEATLESGKFVEGAKKIQKASKETEATVKQSFGNLGGVIKGFGASLAAGLSIGLFTSAIRQSLQFASAIKDVSERVGVTTDELQKFRYAVTQVGGSGDVADKSLEKLGESMSKAASGSKSTIAAFQSVGVSLKDIETKSKTEIFGQIADQMVKQGGAAKNAAAGNIIFGESANKLIPLLDRGSKGLSEFGQAADRLGLVLSDDYINRMDEAGRKIDDLQTVLSIQIAGIVAENSDAIIGFADAIAYLIRFTGEAVNQLGLFRAELANFEAKARNFNPFRTSEGKQQDRANIFRNNLEILDRKGLINANGFTGATRPKPSGSPPDFLAGSSRKGRGGRDTSERDALKRLREDYQLARELNSADRDILRAKQALATDYVDRTQLSVQMLDLEKKAYQAELAYEQEQFKITKGKQGISAANAAILQAKYDEKDALERQAVIAAEEEQRLAEYNQLDREDLAIAREKLESEAQLAETAAERRAVELKLLDLAYQQERLRLQQIVDDEKASYASREIARRRLAMLDNTYANDRQAVINSTRGPMEDYLASLPNTAAKAQEALERLEVQGFEGLIDAALQLSEGFDSAKDALLNTLKQFLLGIARMQLQQGLSGLLGGSSGGIGGLLRGLFGSAQAAVGGNGIGSMGASGGSSFSGYVGIGTPAFATGGGLRIRGIPGIDKNLLSLNNVPLARVSDMEWLNISNDNPRSRASGTRVDMTVYATDANSFGRSEGQITRQLRRKLGTQ